MFDIALGIFLLLSPIFFLPWQIGNVNALQFYQFGVLGNTGYNYLQLQFFCVGVILLFIAALLSKTQREFNDKWIVILLSLFCLNVYFHPLGIKMIVPVLLGFLLYYLVVIYTKNYKSLFKFILCVSLLNTIFAILQFFNINLVYHSTGRIDGLMCLSTHLGVYQLIALPICYALNPYFAIIPIVGILLSKSLTPIFIMFCLVIIKSFTGVKIKGRTFNIGSISAFTLLLLLIIVFIFHNYSFIVQKLNIRLMVWLPTIKEISVKILGYGLKPFRVNSSMGLFENPCNIYLQAIYYLGVLVLVPISMIIKKVIISKDKILSASILIALLVGLEKSILDFPRMAGTVIVLFALLTITKKEGALC